MCFLTQTCTDVWAWLLFWSWTDVWVYFLTWSCTDVRVCLPAITAPSAPGLGGAQCCQLHTVFTSWNGIVVPHLLFHQCIHEPVASSSVSFACTSVLVRLVSVRECWEFCWIKRTAYKTEMLWKLDHRAIIRSVVKHWNYLYVQA